MNRPKPKPKADDINLVLQRALGHVAKRMGRGNAGTMRIDVLLGQLCVELGFCLPPEECEELIERPPNDVDAFTDRVIVAEGLDPAAVERRLRDQVRQRVKAVLDPEVSR